MRQAVCEGCGQSSPLGQTFVVVGKTLCHGCAEQFLKVATQPIPEEAVQRQVDPTVCGFCSADGDRQEYRRVFGVPACEACDDKLRHRPFPRWIKAAAVVLVLLVIGSFVYNFRFLRAHHLASQAFRTLFSGDVHGARGQMDAALALIPDQRELKVYAEFFVGVELLADDKDAESIAKLQYVQGQLHPRDPLQPIVADCIADARAGMAFFAKDYDQFLALSIERNQRHPGQAQYVAGVASAYACKYAVTGDEKHKKEALKHLDEAAKLPQPPQAAEYRDRIMHRLETRKILTHKEFEQQFPNGWKPEKPK